MSGLDFQLIDVKFTEGLDTQTERKLVLPGKWDQLRNTTLSKNNTPVRRDGVAALVASANGNGLATFNDELLAISGKVVSSVSTASSPATNVAVTGSLANVFVTSRDITTSVVPYTGVTPGGIVGNDCAFGNGLVCYVWAEFAARIVSCTIIDEATGAVVLPSTAVSPIASFSPRVVFVNSSFFIFYRTGNTLVCRVITTAAPTVLGANTTLINSANLKADPFPFDAIAFGGSQDAVTVVYGWADGATSVRDIIVKRTGTTPAITSGPTNLYTEAEIPTAGLTGLTVYAFSSTAAGVFALGVGAGTMCGTSGVAISVTGAATTPTSLLDATQSPTASTNHITVTNSGANFQLFWDQQSEFLTANFLPIRTMFVDSTMLIISFATNLTYSAFFRANAAEALAPCGPFIFGKAFTYNSRTFLPAFILDVEVSIAANTNTKATQTTLLLLDGVTGVVMAKALYGTLYPGAGSGANVFVWTPCSTPTVSSGHFAMAVGRRKSLAIFNNVNTSPASLNRITFAPEETAPPISQQLDQATYISGGVLSSYTQGLLVEHGFPLFPEGISAVVAAGAGMTPGAHQIVAIYEWTDNSGNRHQSAPSLAVTITSAAGNLQATVIVPTLLISQKTLVNIVVYMTTSAGLTFYRTASKANTTAAAFVTFTLTSPDATISANELLYTQPNTAGTTLPNIAPPGNNSLAVHQNRIFMDVNDAPGAFRYSQAQQQNTGLQFSPALGGIVDVSGGDIVGFATLDEKVIIFCERKPFVVFGTGPNPAGGFNNYTDPAEIPSGCGCIEARSILSTPAGIIFKSAKGWYMLGRDLVTRYIGAGVQAFDANSVSSGVILEDRREARFSSLSGTQLIYAYEEDQWSTAVIVANSGAGSANYLIADAVWWPTGGYYAHISPTWGLNKDTSGVYFDAPGSSNSVPIVGTSRTAWLKLQNLGGFQRVRRLFLTATSSTAPESILTIQVDYDDAYGLVATGSYTFNSNMATAFPAFVVGTSVDLRHKLRRQKCKSVAFTFVDTPTTNQPAGLNFQALTLECGMKRGVDKLPAKQSID